jgi:Ser-tRNA(Ala) deacylase AlaX
MTELLYLEDAYMRTCQAKVIDVDVDGWRVVLDQTVFYVQGGGQPADHGTLSGPNGDITVTGVKRDDGTVCCQRLTTWSWPPSNGIGAISSCAPTPLCTCSAA